ncbi:MAG: ATP-binding cassette protein [Homoserinimonas sp.]|jgi:iron complex transport system ATP-binding protein|nr:ATP-binding cassette protein [Homoserinimonas sp.]
MTGLQARGVVVRLDGSLIVDGIDCTVPPGSITALIGPNGAGKSTLLRVLAAVERPTSGTVFFGGTDLHRLRRTFRARLVSFVEQDVSTELALTAREVVALGRAPHQTLWQEESADDAAIVNASLSRVAMSSFAERLFTSLSGGERQRVLLAKALAQEPHLLLLDEPTSHLDISASLSTLALLVQLANEGVSVLAALHDLNLALAASDHLLVMHRGQAVAAGPTASLLTPQLIRDVYGVRADILQHPVTGRPVVVFSAAR